MSAHLHPYSHLRNPSHPPWHATTPRFFPSFFSGSCSHNKGFTYPAASASRRLGEQRTRLGAKTPWSRATLALQCCGKARVTTKTGQRQCTLKCSGRGSFDCTSYITKPKLLGRFCCYISSESRSESAAEHNWEEDIAGRGGKSCRGAGSGRQAAGGGGDWSLLLGMAE